MQFRIAFIASLVSILSACSSKDAEDQEPPANPSSDVVICEEASTADGCDYKGARGLREAIDAAKGAADKPVTLILKQGTYKPSAMTFESLNAEKKLRKRKTFLHLKDKYLIIRGEPEALIDATGLEKMSGLSIEGGAVTLENIALQGFTADEPECIVDSKQVCSIGAGVVAMGSAQVKLIGVRSESNGGSGVLADDQATLEMLRTTLKRNTVSGTAALGKSKLTVVASVFQENEQFGLSVLGSAELRLTNSVLVGQRRDGVQIAQGSKVTVVNNTFVRNTSFGISVFSCDGSPTLVAVNNIIVGTRPDGNGAFGFGIGGSCLYEKGNIKNVKASYNLLWDNARHGMGCGNDELCDSTEARVQDPLFVSPVDFHLKSSSPALRSGDPQIANPGADKPRSDRGAFGGPGACELDPALKGC